MEINIYRKGQNTYYRQNQIIWKNHTKRNKTSLLIFAGAGLIYLALGCSELYKKNSFWNFETTLGLAFLFVSIINLYHLVKDKNDYFRKVNLVMTHWAKFNAEIHMKLTDEGIFYKDSQTVYERRWSVFTSYKIDDEFIIFIEVEPTIGDFFINRNELSANDLKELKSVLSSFSLKKYT